MKIEMISAKKDDKCLAELKENFQKEQAVITVSKSVTSKVVQGRKLSYYYKPTATQQKFLDWYSKIRSYTVSSSSRTPVSSTSSLGGKKILYGKKGNKIYFCTKKIGNRRRWCRWITKPEPASPPTAPQGTPQQPPSQAAEPVELKKEDAKVKELQKKLYDLRARNCVEIKYRPIREKKSSVSTEMTIEKQDDIKRAKLWMETEIQKHNTCEQVGKDEANKQNQILKDRETKYQDELEKLVKEQLEAKEDKAENDAWVKKHHEDKKTELKKVEEWHTKAKDDLAKKDYTNKNLEKDLAEAKDKWIKKYHEENKPAHEKAILELDPTERINGLKEDFEKTIIKRNKTVTTL